MFLTFLLVCVFIPIYSNLMYLGSSLHRYTNVRLHETRKVALESSWIFQS